jgi:hypothetical protein
MYLTDNCNIDKPIKEAIKRNAELDVSKVLKIVYFI